MRLCVVSFRFPRSSGELRESYDTQSVNRRTYVKPGGLFNFIVQSCPTIGTKIGQGDILVSCLVTFKATDDASLTKLLISELDSYLLQ
jgi:hypothetical protein